MCWERSTHQIQMTGITRHMPSRDMLLSETFFYFIFFLLPFPAISLHHPIHAVNVFLLFTSLCSFDLTDFPSPIVFFKGVKGSLRTLSNPFLCFRPSNFPLSCSSLLMLCTIVKGVYNGQMILTGPTATLRPELSLSVSLSFSVLISPRSQSPQNA